MKKRYVGYASILFAALCLMFTACKQGVTTGGGTPQTGTVRIVLGGESTRSVDSAGLPVFDEHNTKITVTIKGEKGETEQIEGTNSIAPFSRPIGTKITVKVVVTTTAGRWRGSVEDYAVKAGENAVAVKLSKAPNGVANLFFSTTENKTVLKLEGVSEPLAEIDDPSHPSSELITVRDGIGRIYVVAYDAGPGKRILRRFTTEGKEDTNFHHKLKDALSEVTPVTIAADTNTLFVFSDKTSFYALQENNETFTRSDKYDIRTADASVEEVQAAAAYNGTLFTAGTVAGSPASLSLRAYTVAISGKTVTLTSSGTAAISIPVTDGSEAKAAKCTGVFADATGVYCLIGQKKTDKPGSRYAVGKIVKYEYSSSVLTQKLDAGFKSDAQRFTNGGIGFSADAFSYPAAFIGYDEENLYIADDGVDIQEADYIDWRITGQKDRIATFNRKTGVVTFANSDYKWNTEYRESVPTKIPRLLWSLDASHHSVQLQLKPVDSSNAVPLAENINGESLKTARDSVGNVYVLYMQQQATPSTAPVPKLERYYANGSPDSSFGTRNSDFKWPDTGASDNTNITGIAVDFKTADVFLLKYEGGSGHTSAKITAYLAKADDGYASFSAPVSVDIPNAGHSHGISSLTVFDNTLFFAMEGWDGGQAKSILYACKMQTAGTFSFTGTPASVEFPTLRSRASYPMTCTGLFADRQGVYGLIAHQSRDARAGLYAQGQLVRYTYSGSAFTEETKIGFNVAAPTTGSIGYDEHYFSYPVGFLGYDGDTLYIADDGIDI